MSGVKSAATSGQSTQNTQSSAKHPWDGLCLGEILEAGYRPIFRRSTAFWSDEVFADPISNDYVAVAGCGRSPFDMADFHGHFEFVETKYHPFGQNAEFFKTEVWKPRPGVNGSWTSLGYYRR